MRLITFALFKTHKYKISKLSNLIYVYHMFTYKTIYATTLLDDVLELISQDISHSCSNKKHKVSKSKKKKREKQSYIYIYINLE